MPKFADLQLPAGHRGSTLIHVASGADGTPIGIPLLVVAGARAGPVLAVDAGCHGDEHEGTLAVLKLFQSVDPGALSGTLVMTMALNVPAFYAMGRGNPFDHWHGDMNRLFPGNPDGNLTQRIAHAYVEEVCRKADFVLSLHSGATYIHWAPTVVVEINHAPSMDLARQMGPEWDVLYAGTSFRGTAKQALNEMGIPAVAVEIGGAGQRLLAEFERNVDMVVAGLRNIMIANGMLPGEVRVAERFRLVRMQAVRSSKGGVIVPEPDFHLRWQVQEGQPLLRLFDLYGQQIEVVTAPFDGLVMGLRTYPYAPPGWPLVWMGVPIQ